MYRGVLLVLSILSQENGMHKKHFIFFWVANCVDLTNGPKQIHQPMSTHFESDICIHTNFYKIPGPTNVLKLSNKIKTSGEESKMSSIWGKFSYTLILDKS